MNSIKKYLHKVISSETLSELDDFLNTYPNENISYGIEHEARKLYLKVTWELLDSIKKEYKEEFDRIIKDNDYFNIQVWDTEAIKKINFEFEELTRRVKAPNSEVKNKLEQLKKYFIK